MTRRQYALALVVMLIGGLAGGALADLLFWGEVRAEGPALVTATEIRLVDEGGRTRLLMSVLRGRPRLILTDESGEFRAELGLAPEGGPALWLRDRDGRARLALSLSGSGLPLVTLTDDQGRARAGLGLGGGGAPSLILRDAAGRDRVALWQEEDEIGLALADEARRPRAHLAVKQGKPSLAFYRTDRGVLWFAPPAP